MMGEYNHHLSKTHTCVCSSMAEEGHKPCSAIAVPSTHYVFSSVIRSTTILVSNEKATAVPNRKSHFVYYLQKTQ